MKKTGEGYSAAKNFGNERAKYDWILSLDADEVLSPELAKEVHDIFERNDLDLDDLGFRFSIIIAVSGSSMDGGSRRIILDFSIKAKFFGIKMQCTKDWKDLTTSRSSQRNLMVMSIITR